MGAERLSDEQFLSRGKDVGIETEEKAGKRLTPAPALQIVWPNVAIYTTLHTFALFGIYLASTKASIYTLAFNLLLYVISGLGITAGAHRLWAHKSFSATKPLRYFLALANVLAFENDVIEWCRDHRGHHKWSETSADPHDANRGSFFAHIGWLLVRKHPDVIRKGKTIPLDDLFTDPVVVWQRRNYYSLALLTCVYMPCVVPHVLWGEGLVVAYFVAVARYVLMLHATWCVNSIAHKFGNRPYDPNISPSQNPVTSVFALGEGWHNFHHTFPQDYRASELPWTINVTTLFIDICARFGLAYDLKITNQSSIEARKETAGSYTRKRRE